MTIVPVLMAGGAGTRLWPLSRDDCPKPFLTLGGAKTLIQATADRVAGEQGDVSFGRPVVIVGEQHVQLAVDQLRGHELGIIVVEPVGRNTAACAAVAAEIIAQDDPNALVLLLPTDHEVGDENAFRVAVAEAAHAARAGELVVFGVRPTRPETGYGYVLAGENIGASMRVVERFVEKPDARTAEAYLTDGRYFWNAGILLARPDKLLLELDRYRPDILAGARTALSRAKLRDGALHLDPSLFAACPAESLDYAVLEQTRCAALILVDMGWSDLGGFDAIYEISSKDAQGNAGDTAMLIDVNNTLVRTDGYAVAAVGVSDLTIIVHNGVVLVSARNRAEDVARLSAEFRSGGMKQAN